MTKEEFEKIVGEYVGGLVTERCCGDKGCPSIFCVDSVDGKYPEATTKPMGHATRGIKLENNGGVWFDIDGKPLFDRWAGYYAMTDKADELRYYMGQAGFKRKGGNDPQSYYEKGHPRCRLNWLSQPPKEPCYSAMDRGYARRVRLCRYDRNRRVGQPRQSRT